MAKKNVKGGDLILLPTPEGAEALGKVLFVSNHFRNMVILRLWPVAASPATNSTPGETVPSHLVFASKGSIREGSWPIIGFEELSQREDSMLRFRCAGSVWVADEEVGPATERDRAELPELRALGDGLVELVVAEILQGKCPRVGFPIGAEA